MSIIQTNTSDSVLNGYLNSIRSAEYGKNARIAMANSVQRCYEVAKQKTGAMYIPQSSITEHTDRIRNAVFGEEVRDALKMGLELCYSARRISVTNIESAYFNELITAQTGEELKNGILRCIIKCYQDVNA